MTPTQDSDGLRALEQELQECERKRDYLTAIDIYEEIESKGWITVKHQVGLGFCYMKLRRRQDAREAWLKGYTLDPSHQRAIEALDEFFPGWKRAAPPRVRKPPAPAPSPPEPRAGRPASRTDRPAPGRPTQPVTGSAPPAGPAAQPAPTRSAPVAQGRQPHPAHTAPAVREAATLAEGEINWDYVTNDLEECQLETAKAGKEMREQEEAEEMPEFSLDVSRLGAVGDEKKSKSSRRP